MTQFRGQITGVLRTRNWRPKWIYIGIQFGPADQQAEISFVACFRARLRFLTRRESLGVGMTMPKSRAFPSNFGCTVKGPIFSAGSHLRTPFTRAARSRWPWRRSSSMPPWRRYWTRETRVRPREVEDCDAWRHPRKKRNRSHDPTKRTTFGVQGNFRLAGPLPGGTKDGVTCGAMAKGLFVGTGQLAAGTTREIDGPHSFGDGTTSQRMWHGCGTGPAGCWPGHRSRSEPRTARLSPKSPEQGRIACLT